MAWTVLYSVSTEGYLVLRCTSYHDPNKAQEEIERKILSMWGPDADYSITCMVKGNHPVWIPVDQRLI